MDTAAYLKRIGYTGPRAPSLETLRALQLAHLYTVPFENLDIQRGRPLSLDGAALFDKIVTRRRGGFCYELNGMFRGLLRELGFRVTMLSAEVAHEAGGFSAAFDHLTLRVDLDEPWLADVGFGDSFREPPRLGGSGGEYRVIEEGGYRVLQRFDATWRPQYRFTLEPHVLEDFAARCVYHQTSPDSHFTQNRICTLATPEGRITISGMRLIVSAGGAKTERVLADQAECAAILRETFGVVE
jgi:N-hydroxyarylamine O-acetyltransferase